MLERMKCMKNLSAASLRGAPECDGHFAVFRVASVQLEFVAECVLRAGRSAGVVSNSVERRVFAAADGEPETVAAHRGAHSAGRVPLGEVSDSCIQNCCSQSKIRAM